MNLRGAKQKYIKNHKLGKLTIQQLKEKANELDVKVYGDKAQILQCLDQSEYLQKLFKGK